MIVIFCDSVIDNKVVEPDYLDELNAAKRVGFHTSLISFEELTDGNIKRALRLINPSEIKEKGIYRGWMLTPEHYQSLYDGLIKKNIELINTPTEYKHCHYLPESYELIKDNTPKSNWSRANDPINEQVVIELTEAFANSPIIVKDYVKSEKHYWKEACYIPDASDTHNILAITEKFIELRGSSLNEGLVFRQFEELEFLIDHSKSGMPLTKEFRVFFANKKIVSVFDYWDEGEYGETKPELDHFIQIAQTIDSNFFTMDIAQKKNGEWIIMELGDGQVAGLPDNAHIEKFYKLLQEAL
ncbi:MAG: ATP-grasp domain-containing protein [Crocinitomicaceae bacterium]|nr:ATP-grasp domain-containing protein [Crocinitomicaceae bacterium]